MGNTNQIVLVLEGELGAKYIPKLELIADCPAQAIRGLVANFPDIQSTMIESDRKGNVYALTQGDRYFGIDELDTPISGELHLKQVIAGSGDGLKILLGAGLIAASFAIPGAGAVAAGTAATSGAAAVGSTNVLLSGALLSIGASLTLSGLSSLIAPRPKEKRDESFLFGNTTQTTQNGAVIPMMIGEIFVTLNGKIVVSSGIEVTDIPIDTVTTGTNGKGGK